MQFFDEVAREEGEVPTEGDLAASPLAQLWNKATVFTAWKPTPGKTIEDTMLGVATGKGLDVEGTSAKRGNISSYVPFVRIYEERTGSRRRTVRPVVG